MRISVVNHSSHADEQVQEVIRAVNRQIAEDFARYWNRRGELRLEGPVGREPDPRRPEELRGDAVLYLWEKVDPEAALGFHDLNYRGIPFAVVFTDLCRAAGEDWSITLSHEALELLVDPEVNLLVRGPHPEEPTRWVYHWYEVCDAVQAQSYEIDGIAVSNFVLPLYFTQSDEPGSRNDFLGIRSGQASLASFGVAPGGYIGFLDPETGRHEPYFAPEADARRRWALRQRAGFARRAVRRQRECDPEPVLCRLLGMGVDEPPPGPWFEGFAVDIRPPRGEDPYDLLDRAARAVLGRSWRRHWLAVEPTAPPVGQRHTAYELVPRGTTLTAAEAWEKTHAFRRQRGVVDAEPDFVFFRADSEAIEDLPARRRWALFDGDHLPETADRPEWCLDLMRIREAWQETRGAGVRIAQPDTGILEHPELAGDAGTSPIDTERDWDFVDDEDDARAEPQQDDWVPGGPAHGTATASVVVSPPGPPPGEDTDRFVSGVAPEARLTPLRVGNGVVHFSMRRVRKAIEYATREGFHVVSLSLGGPFPSRHLRAALREAERRGVIVIAAAGNHVPLRPVVWPARYPETLAVAACNVRREPWRGSSRGGAVDVTAPGESVWRALVDTEASPAQRFRVERSSGTSYATAHVAGVCALWLSHHGPEALATRYGPRLTEAFRYVLARAAAPSEHLDPEDFGPGIVDARAALDVPLPSLEALRRFASGGTRARRRRTALPERSADDPEASLAALFPPLDRRSLQQGLESLLDTDAAGVRRGLRELGDELVFHFAVDPRLRRQFAAHCRHGESVRARARETPAMRRWRAAAAAPLRRRLRAGASPQLAARLP